MRVIVARSNFFNPRCFFSTFSGNRDAKFRQIIRKAMPGWLPLDAFVPRAANLHNETLSLTLAFRREEEWQQTVRGQGLHGDLT